MNFKYKNNSILNKIKKIYKKINQKKIKQINKN